MYIRGARCLGWTWHEHLHWISEALLAESEFKSSLYHLGVSPRFASERILYFILFPDCSSRLLLSSSAWDLTKQGQWLIYLVVDTLAAESFAPCYSCRCCCSCSSPYSFFFFFFFFFSLLSLWSSLLLSSFLFFVFVVDALVAVVVVVAVVGGAVVVIDVADLVVVVVVIVIVVAVVVAAAVVVPLLLRSPKASPKRMAFGRATRFRQTLWNELFC